MVSAGAGIAAEVGAEVEAVRVGVAEVASASAGIAAEIGAEIDADEDDADVAVGAADDADDAVSSEDEDEVEVVEEEVAKAHP